MTITAPSENNNADNKPFCCTHCGNENYIKYGKNNEVDLLAFNPKNRNKIHVEITEHNITVNDLKESIERKFLNKNIMNDIYKRYFGSTKNIKRIYIVWWHRSGNKYKNKDIIENKLDIEILSYEDIFKNIPNETYSFQRKINSFLKTKIKKMVVPIQDISEDLVDYIFMIINNTTFAGWACILYSILTVVIYGIIMNISKVFSILSFISLTIFIYIWISLKRLLNDKYNFYKADIYIFIMILANILNCLAWRMKMSIMTKLMIIKVEVRLD